MFSADFYPTPDNIIEVMCDGLTIADKIILEPSAGKGNIVKYLQAHGAKEVIACEKNPELVKIVKTYCQVIAEDFLTLTSDKVSHIDAIVINPPFSADEKHILHAFNIAPAGCKIRALCNVSTVKNAYYSYRQELKKLIESYGNWQSLGQCFTDAERRTEVDVALVYLEKPGENYSQEFDGFFLEEEEEVKKGSGLLPYNIVRDAVNRYVEAIKIFDSQLETAVKMDNILKGFYTASIGFVITKDKQPIERNNFKKDLQKQAWKWIFAKLDMQKYSTKKLKEDINKFVEKQSHIPFTMRNVYKMLDIVVGTQGDRMNRAILEVFDKVTKHSHDNHYKVEGWKTNSHYLLTKRFIIPSYYKEEIEDMVKALCFVTGDNYDRHISLEERTNYDYAMITNNGEFIPTNYYPSKKIYQKYEIDRIKMEDYPNCKLISLEWDYGKWFDWAFFKVKKYKKGTIHFEFKDEDVWARFNQKVAEIKGFPLPEKKSQTKYQERQNGRKPEPRQKPSKPSIAEDPKINPVILATFKIKVGA